MSAESRGRDTVSAESGRRDAASAESGRRDAASAESARRDAVSAESARRDAAAQESQDKPAGSGDRTAADGKVSRREAVKLLGMVPLLGVLEWTLPDVQRAAAMVSRLVRAGGDYEPKFFTAHEWRTVNILLDYIIPADERSGSATDAKVPEFIDFMYSDELTATSEQAKTAMRDGLRWLDGECERRFRRNFATITDAERRQVLDDIAWPLRARAEMTEGVAFFERIRDMTAAGFFSSEAGWRDLDYQGHTFVLEWKGCPEPALRKLGVSLDQMNTRVPIQYGQD